MSHVLEVLAMLRDLAVVVGVGLGIKLYSVLLKAKEAEAELLKARVEHLEKMSAPALADQLQKMAPLLDDYAKKNAELEEKQRGFPDVVANVSKNAHAVGIGAGTLNAILAIQEFISAEVIRAGLSGQDLPRWVHELPVLLATELTPLANEGFKGKLPELRYVKNGIALIRHGIPEQSG